MEKTAKSDKTDPEMAKKVIFWPFLAFDGRLGGLKDSLEVRVEHETCTTIHGTYLEGILSQKKFDRVGRGGQKRSLFGQNMASEASLGP